MVVHGELYGGNIEVLEVTARGAKLAIRADSQAPEFRQWFFFTVEGAKARKLTFEISKAGETTYPDAWDGYNVCASYDQEQWFRVPTQYDGKALRWSLKPAAPTVYFAYFAAFDLKRHERLLEEVARSSMARVEVIGQSAAGRAIEACVVGEQAEGKRSVWVIARQHPGETMAEWFVEGLLLRLVDSGPDPLVAELLSKAVIYVVPNMNPDGSALGHLRTNAKGTNLNRAWLEPDAETSPEVLCVRRAMEELGVDMFLDIHGDERNPFCFLAGCEGNPGYTERLRGLENLFEQSLCAFDPDFQDEYGYERDHPWEGDLRTASNWVGERFDCLSYTLEMPFKDAANHPDPTVGWSPDRARRLGGACVESVVVCVDSLRDDDCQPEGAPDDGPGPGSSDGGGDDGDRPSGEGQGEWERPSDEGYEDGDRPSNEGPDHWDEPSDEES